MAAETIPAHIRDTYADWRWTPAWTYGDVVTTWRLERDGETRYAKVKESDAVVSLRREADAMRWTAKYLRVPEVLDSGSRDGIDWLVTAAMHGASALEARAEMAPEQLVPIFARGLRRFHDALPVHDCPFSFTAAEAIAVTRERIDDGRIPWTDIHDVHKGMTLEEAFARLVATAPTTEDLVVCHGDYCFPNAFLEGDEVTGYLDLGEVAVSDRWLDVAIGMWTTTWNVGAGYEELFAASYGVDVDEDKLAFFRLLYDLVP